MLGSNCGARKEKERESFVMRNTRKIFDEKNEKKAAGGFRWSWSCGGGGAAEAAGKLGGLTS